MTGATVEGVGVHTGRPCRVRLVRLDDRDAPVHFALGDRIVPAALAAVADTRRRTTLAVGSDDARTSVHQVEHLLAALHLRGHWRGVRIELDGEELPILDGSAGPWLEAVDALGEPAPPPAPLRPERAFEVVAGDGRARLEPGPASLCYEIAFDHPAIGRQRWCGTPERYGEVAAARTFGLLAEVDVLHARGLAAGASLENAIVFDDDGPMRPLRVPDEPVRHKVLDALGDLFLLGRPLEAHLTFVRGSHALHVRLMRELALRTRPGGVST